MTLTIIKKAKTNNNKEYYALANLKFPNIQLGYYFNDDYCKNTSVLIKGGAFL